MTTTDQRPAPRTSPTDLSPGIDPATLEAMIAPIALCAVEIVRDRRPETALARVITPEVGHQLSRRAALTRRLRATTGFAPAQRVLISGVRTCVVSDRTVEASCVVREPGRSRFLAMRWELRHTGWRITVLEIG